MNVVDNTALLVVQSVGVVMVAQPHGIPKRLHTDSNTYFVHLKWHHTNEESMKWPLFPALHLSHSFIATLTHL